MTIAIRKQLQRRSLPEISFGPFRFLQALPWLVVAAAMRVVAYGGGPTALPATIVASIAVLHAFLVVAQRSIELADGRTTSVNSTSRNSPDCRWLCCGGSRY